MIKLTVELKVNEQGQQEIGLISEPLVDVVAALGLLEAAKLVVVNGGMRTNEQPQEQTEQ